MVQGSRFRAQWLPSGCEGVIVDRVGTAAERMGAP